MCDFEETLSAIKSKPKQFTKKYNSAWENYKEFKDWIAPSKKGARCFYCKLCNRDYDGGIIAVKQHSISPNHPKQDHQHKLNFEVLLLNDKNFFSTAASYDSLFVIVYLRYKYIHTAENYCLSFEEINERVLQEFHGKVRVAIANYYDSKRICKLFLFYFFPRAIFCKYKQEPIIYDTFRNGWRLDAIVKFLKSVNSNKK